MSHDTTPSQGSAGFDRADSRLAGEVRALLVQGETAKARERFEALVERHQRRATRIAYYYLRDPADVDEAVQDAFLKAFLHLPSFREDLFFEFWFTRIVVNGCLDRLKARSRRARWLRPIGTRSGAGDDERELIERRPTLDPSPEALLLEQERRVGLARAIARLPGRQRTVVLLSQFEGHTDTRGWRDARHKRRDGARAFVPCYPLASTVAPRRALAEEPCSTQARGDVMVRWLRQRLGRTDPHLPDTRLLELLVPPADGTASAGSDLNAPNTHLSACTSCARRLAELRAFLDSLTEQSAADFDATFSPQHLARQRASILRRLERATRPHQPVRILRFPAAARPALARVHAARRWLGAAAAAGLLAGVGIGQFVHLHPASSPAAEPVPTSVASTTVSREDPGPPPVPNGPAHLETDDDAFMDQVESIVVDLQIQELSTLDALTPQVRDVALRQW